MLRRTNQAALASRMMQKASSLGAQYRVVLDSTLLAENKKKRDLLRLLIEIAVVGFVRLKLGEIKRTACDFAVFASSTVLGKRSPLAWCIRL